MVSGSISVNFPLLNQTGTAMIKCPACNSLFRIEVPPLTCPTCNQKIEEVDGVFCFPISDSDEYYFPKEGFHLLYQHEADHFWFRSRNEIIGKFLGKYFQISQEKRQVLDLPTHEKPRICEVGCGTGLVSQYLTRMGFRMTCSDLFLEGLSFARQRNSGEQYFRCNLYDFPFYNEFDAILACDVLEHLDDDITALYRLNQALKPGGICLITVPAGKSLWSAVDAYAGHKRRYDAEGLKAKVSQAGFTPIRVSYFMTVPYPILRVKRALEHGIQSQRNVQGKGSNGINELKIPHILNELLYILLWPERRLIHSVNIPFGSSLICIARKPHNK